VKGGVQMLRLVNSSMIPFPLGGPLRETLILENWSTLTLFRVN
jgi:hypothetical protein